MFELNLNMYHATAIAALVLLLGRWIIKKVPALNNYCIPAPVVGGLVYALVHLALYAAGVLTISFDGTLQTFFMTVFFTSVGFMASFKLLKKGGMDIPQDICSYDRLLPAVLAHLRGGDEHD